MVAREGCNAWLNFHRRDADVVVKSESRTLADSFTKVSDWNTARGRAQREIVLLRDASCYKALTHALGVRVARATDYNSSAVRTEDITEGTALLLDELGIAIVAGPPEQMNELEIVADESIIAKESERTVYVLDGGEPAAEATAERRSCTESHFTWGLQATNVSSSRYSGRGVRVAVLDTGFNFSHPDFSQRSITTRSFVRGLPAEDALGHGTHCIGTSCGPRNPAIRPGYGVAFGAEIFAGKVLNDSGAGADADILAGINWAIANKCRVVSLSFGVAVQPGARYSRIYEAAARRALAAGTLLVAAAGNLSARSLGIIAPVVQPANCPSIMAVGAVDAELEIVDSSCRGLRGKSGRIDIAGPGADILSSWRMPKRYRTFTGTSMAAPYVAGIAALHLEATPQLTARQLWARLTQTAQRLDLSSTDAGAGLVQAPQAVRSSIGGRTTQLPGGL
jgi:subtilisin family serine protease